MVVGAVVGRNGSPPSHAMKAEWRRWRPFPARGRRRGGEADRWRRAIRRGQARERSAALRASGGAGVVGWPTGPSGERARLGAGPSRPKREGERERREKGRRGVGLARVGRSRGGKRGEREDWSEGLVRERKRKYSFLFLK